MTETRGAGTGAVAQFIRYAMVGVATNLIGYGIFLFITYLGMEPKQAMTLLYIIAATISFILNRKWSFSHRGGWLWAAARYCLAHLLGYLTNLAMLFTLVDLMGYPYQAVQGAAVFVVAALLFLIFRYFVFPRTGEPA